MDDIVPAAHIVGRRLHQAQLHRAVEQRSDHRRAAEGADQHCVGVLILHGEFSGGKIDVYALPHLDAVDVSVVIRIDKVIVAHRHNGVVLLDAHHIAVGIHVENRSVGQQIGIGVVHRIVILNVVVQNVHAAEHGVRGQRGQVILFKDIAERAGNGNGNSGSAQLDIEPGAGFHGQIHASLAAFHMMDIHPGIRGILVGLIRKLRHQIHDHGTHAQVYVPLRRNVDAAVQNVDAVAVLFIIVGKDPGEERRLSVSHRGRAVHDKLVGPDGRHFPLGGKVGDLRDAGEGAAGTLAGGLVRLAGPEEGNRAVVEGQEALHVHVAGCLVDHGERRSRAAGLRFKHVFIQETHIDGWLDVAYVLHRDVVQNDGVIRVVGEGHLRDPRLIDNSHLSLDGAAVKERITGHLVDDAAEGERLLVSFCGFTPDLLLIPHAHLADLQLILMHGDVEVDARGSVAQVEDRAARNRGAGAAVKAAEAVRVLVDEAACGLAPDPPGIIKVVCRHGKAGAPEDEARSDGGSRRGAAIDSGLGVAVANGVQLDGGVALDVGPAVLRGNGAVNAGTVMGCEVRIAHIHGRRELHILLGAGLNVSPQGLALGVGVGVGLQLADKGIDVHIPPFDQGFAPAAAAQRDRGDQIQIVDRGGIGRNTGAGAVRSGVRLDTAGGCVAGDPDGVVAVINDHTTPSRILIGDIGVGVGAAHHHFGRGVHGGVGQAFAEGQGAGVLEAGAGLDRVVGASAGMDKDVAVVGTQIAAGQDVDGHIPSQRVDGGKNAFAEEAAVAGQGFGRHLGRGIGAYGQGLAGIQGSLNDNGVRGRDGVLALGRFHVQTETDAAAVGDAGGAGVVRGGHADAAVGFDHRMVRNTSFRIVVTEGGKRRGVDAYAADVDPLVDHGLHSAHIGRLNADVAAGDDRAAMDPGAHTLLFEQRFSAAPGHLADGGFGIGDRDIGELDAAARLGPGIGVGLSVRRHDHVPGSRDHSAGNDRLDFITGAGLAFQTAGADETGGEGCLAEGIDGRYGIGRHVQRIQRVSPTGQAGAVDRGRVRQGLVHTHAEEADGGAAFAAGTSCDGFGPGLFGLEVAVYPLGIRVGGIVVNVGDDRYRAGPALRAGHVQIRALVRGQVAFHHVDAHIDGLHIEKRAVGDRCVGPDGAGHLDGHGAAVEGPAGEPAHLQAARTAHPGSSRSAHGGSGDVGVDANQGRGDAAGRLRGLRLGRGGVFGGDGEAAGLHIAAVAKLGFEAAAGLGQANHDSDADQRHAAAAGDARVGRGGAERTGDHLSGNMEGRAVGNGVHLGVGLGGGRVGGDIQTRELEALSGLPAHALQGLCRHIAAAVVEDGFHRQAPGRDVHLTDLGGLTAGEVRDDHVHRDADDTQFRRRFVKIRRGLAGAGDADDNLAVHDSLSFLVC